MNVLLKIIHLSAFLWQENTVSFLDPA